MRYFILLCLLCSCAFAQNRPEITTAGDTLFAPEAKTYQWLHNGVDLPGETRRFLVPTLGGSYTVRIQSLESEPVDFAPLPSVVVSGAVLDEFLRPINGAEVTVAGVKTNSDAEGRFYITAQRAERLAARAQIPGYHAHTVGFRPTAADTQFVYLHLAKSITTHKLPANEGGTISQGGFWLTLPPNAVVDEDGKPYSGEIHLSVVARRPGDRDFAQRMPGGDFMAVDAAGESKVLVSYGFTGVEMTTADGKPLNMAPDSTATIEFLITEEQRPGAPDEMPLWHFDEEQGLWVEAGTVRKEGLTYRAEVGHFSWWNCDFPYPPAYVEGNVVDCKGNPVTGGIIVVNQRQAYTDNEGRFNGTVPATIDLDFHVVNTDTTLAPLAENEKRPLGTFDAGWGQFEAFGIADTNKLLTVFAYGETEGVEYSLDGDNWQSEPVFVLQNDSFPSEGWARQSGDKQCRVLRFDSYRHVLFVNCRFYSTMSMPPGSSFGDPLEALNARKPIYQATVQYGTVSDWVRVAATQPCVQYLSLEYAYIPGEDAVYDQLFSYWQNMRELSSWGPGFPAAMGNLPLLTTLAIDLNQNFSPVDFPESFANLSSLKSLDIKWSYLSALPNWISQWKQLESLSFSDSRIDLVSDSFGDLENLQSLDFMATNVTLPNSISNLRRLKNLNVTSSHGFALPLTIGNLDSLEYLGLESCYLESAPATLGNLLTLKNLDLFNNYLTSVPETFGNLVNLETLDLGNNRLTSVPESLGNLTALFQLVLYFNQITSIPESFGNLAGLYDLYLNDNQLTSVPESLGNLPHLMRCWLGNNQLTTLPASFADLADTLDSLDLTGNPISPEEQARIRAMLPNTQITF